MIRLIYYRFFYRRLMKLAHRYGWHHTTTYYPEGDTLLVCNWCGLRYVAKRVEDMPLISANSECRPQLDGKTK